MKIILASASPRRQKMMADLGIQVDVCPADIDETPLKGEQPRDYVKRVSEAKALAVRSMHSGAVVIAGDTSVVVGCRILGKPETAADCAEMMRLISGRRHVVLSCVTVVDASGKVHSKLTKTVVKVKPLTESDIQKHVDSTENWQGKAGGYGIQTTAGGSFVTEVHGSYTGVVGLPLVEAITLLRRAGVDV